MLSLKRRRLVVDRLTVAFPGAADPGVMQSHTVRSEAARSSWLRSIVTA
jgi:hypothetical protein